MAARSHGSVRRRPADPVVEPRPLKPFVRFPPRDPRCRCPCAVAPSSWSTTSGKAGSPRARRRAAEDVGRHAMVAAARRAYSASGMAAASELRRISAGEREPRGGWIGGGQSEMGTAVVAAAAGGPRAFHLRTIEGEEVRRRRASKTSSNPTWAQLPQHAARAGGTGDSCLDKAELIGAAALDSSSTAAGRLRQQQLADMACSPIPRCPSQAWSDLLRRWNGRVRGRCREAGGEMKYNAKKVAVHLHSMVLNHHESTIFDLEAKCFGARSGRYLEWGLNHPMKSSYYLSIDGSIAEYI
ncbi:hypothetical protein EJB05_54238 [Eragrostis curvula]|uniref:Uncharacterized protein n=1 Tax=Eragrostis curvula TaxID=38414 RepID=A0A5J9SMZ2_9POAL|nr:hypothetical protein EJB05_54238 [Eragrostis curvula]